MPNQRSYWETFSGYTGVSSLVSCKRFENLMSLIHFVDNNSVTEETKKNWQVFKVWGRIGVSGFLYHFDIYQGRINEKTSNDLGISSEVDKSLCEILPSGHNFKSFADNFFTSLALVDEL